MDETKFTDTMSGTLIPTQHGVNGFCPNPLPPQIDINPISGALAKASIALGGLEHLAKTVQNPYLLIRPLQRKEALRSSAMEGTYSTADNLAIVQAYSETGGDESHQEVLNYIRALDYAQTAMEELPISHRVIKGMHKILLEKLSRKRVADKRAGDYKIDQNWIGASVDALVIDHARFVPPPPETALRCMDALEHFINNKPESMPALIAAALVHYQFETIHPFSDGNGRIGRMLVPLYLMQEGALSKPWLYISPYIEQHKDAYIDTMFGVSATGDWTSWFRFFLTAIEKSCESTIETIHKLNALREDYRKRLQRKTRSNAPLIVCDYLFAQPVVSIPDVQAVAKVTYRSAQKTVEILCKHDILTSIEGFERPKLFWAQDVIRLSDDP
ncbi:MAG: Fic family protein [Proteobacteria bacterium]|nr:Fic family protein [Pseudomonadota bacterium]